MRKKFTFLNIERLALLTIFLSFAAWSYAETLTFDQPFGTQAWTENGLNWSWDNTGWDNIRTYQPYAGSGHAMTAPDYSSKLSAEGVTLNIQGLWVLLTNHDNDVTAASIRGYDVNGTEIYSQSISTSDMLGYTYITLNWTNVRSIKVTYSASSMSTASLYYDEMSYTIAGYLTGVETPESKMNIYPNPSSDFIYVADLNKNTAYEIVSLAGVQVKSGNTGTLGRIDIQNMNNGLYFLKINGTALKFMKK